MKLEYPMIIGDGFSKKYQNVLKEIEVCSGKDINHKVSVQEINGNLGHDRTEIKNILEYLQELGYIKILTIGGPLLYGHITITREGIAKCRELN